MVYSGIMGESQALPAPHHEGPGHCGIIADRSMGFSPARSMDAFGGMGR